VNIDSLYAQIKAEIAWQQVIGRKIRPQVNISESDIDMTIDQLAHVSGKKQYHVAEILLNVKDPAEDTDVRSKAEDLVRKIKEGERFSTVARENSQAPGANNGGDMGWVQEGQLSADLDHALAQLQPGQITAPILADNSYHILFLREVRRSADDPVAQGPQPAAPAQGPIVTLKQIVIPVTQKDSPAVIKAKMERGIALKKEIKSCEAMDKRLKEFPGSGTLGKGLQNNLPDPLRKIVGKLGVNELSAPIHAPGGWAMIMVCAREEGTPPAAAAAPETPAPKFSLDKTDEKARENVADKLGAQRMNQMADHYLRDLRAAAFIDKRI
jgi:peptidyl-prolyl cis-trans isomerase SurA